jgi:hypothetical protein
MQCTIIAVQVNGAQVILGTDLQEHRVQTMINGAVSASMQFERSESRYRSFLVLGTTATTSTTTRYDAGGHVMSRQVGLG